MADATNTFPMNTVSMKIVLIGASMRPLIASCLRAGHVPVAFDFFADWDSERLIQQSGCIGASLTKIDRYADLLERDLSALGDAAILAGGAELRPELVAAVGRQLPLLGVAPEGLAAIADPIRWLQVLNEAGVRIPETVRELPAENTSDWLVKQRGTCGGSGVRAFENSERRDLLVDCYYQKRIGGDSMSAIFVSRRPENDDAGGTFLVGCTRQWLAADFDQTGTGGGKQARPFAYRGSIGPIAISDSVRQQLDRMANVLAQTFSLVGVWGLDFVLDAEQKVWPVDLNPRMTASAELFESAIEQSNRKFQSVVDLHLLACDFKRGDINRVNRLKEFERLADDRAAGQCRENFETKRILFFEGPGVVEIDEAKFQRLTRLHLPEFFHDNEFGASIADVPQRGDRIEAGRPLLTIRSRAKTEAAAVVLLDDLMAEVQACLQS